MLAEELLECARSRSGECARSVWLLLFLLVSALVDLVVGVILLRECRLGGGVKLIVVIVALERLELPPFGTRTLRLVEWPYAGARSNVFDAV